LLAGLQLGRSSRGRQFGTDKQTENSAQLSPILDVGRCSRATREPSAPSRRSWRACAGLSFGSRGSSCVARPAPSGLARRAQQTSAATGPRVSPRALVVERREGAQPSALCAQSSVSFVCSGQTAIVGPQTAETLERGPSVRFYERTSADAAGPQLARARGPRAKQWADCETGRLLRKCASSVRRKKFAAASWLHNLAAQSSPPNVRCTLLAVRSVQLLRLAY